MKQGKLIWRKLMEETGQFLLWVGIALFLALAIADTGRQE